MAEFIFFVFGNTHIFKVFRGSFRTEKIHDIQGRETEILEDIGVWRISLTHEPETLCRIKSFVFSFGACLNYSTGSAVDFRTFIYFQLGFQFRQAFVVETHSISITPKDGIQGFCIFIRPEVVGITDIKSRHLVNPVPPIPELFVPVKMVGN